MGVLARGTESDHAHDEVLSGHEGELFANATRDDSGVDDETGDNVVEDAEEDVSCEEGVGDIDAADGARRGVSCQESSDRAVKERWLLRIIQCTLEPLCRVGVKRVLA